MSDQPILIIPRLANSGPHHWQRYWEQLLPNAQRVTQSDWDNPDPVSWVAALDAAVRSSPLPPVLVAHSLGCAVVAHWSAQNDCSIKGALLVSPSDIDSPMYTPDVVRSFSPMPLHKLPFPSIVVASTNDPYADIRRAESFAQAWTSHFITIGALGHINAESNLGLWQEGQKLLESLCTSERRGPTPPHQETLNLE